MAYGWEEPNHQTSGDKRENSKCETSSLTIQFIQTIKLLDLFLRQTLFVKTLTFFPFLLKSRITKTCRLMLRQYINLIKPNSFISLFPTKVYWSQYVDTASLTALTPLSYKTYLGAKLLILYCSMRLSYSCKL